MLLDVCTQAVSNSSLTNAEVSNWALVTVQLVGVNNHRPTFSQTVYNATIGTNSPPNTLLMFNPRIVVSDMDMVINIYEFFLILAYVFSTQLGSVIASRSLKQL